MTLKSVLISTEDSFVTSRRIYLLVTLKKKDTLLLNELLPFFPQRLSALYNISKLLNSLCADNKRKLFFLTSHLSHPGRMEGKEGGLGGKEGGSEGSIISAKQGNKSPDVSGEGNSVRSREDKLCVGFTLCTHPAHTQVIGVDNA